MDFFFAIENNVIFDQHSLYNGYTYETEFLEKLWKSCKNGQKYNNTILYLYTAKEFLKTEFTFTNPERGRKISWGQMQVKVCDEIKSLRNIIWKSLSVIYDNPEYHELVLDLLSNIRIGGLEAEDRLELLQSDFETIYTIFENKETINFDDTLVLSHFKNLLAQFGKNDDRFTKLETCHEEKIKALNLAFYSRMCYERENGRLGVFLDHYLLLNDHIESILKSKFGEGVEWYEELLNWIEIIKTVANKDIRNVYELLTRMMYVAINYLEDNCRESAYLGMFRFVRVSAKSAQKTLPRLSRDLPKMSPTLFSISPSCSKSIPPKRWGMDLSLCCIAIVTSKCH